MSTGLPLPLVKQVKPVTQIKWRVESIKTSKGGDGKYFDRKPTEVVLRSANGRKPARPRLAHRSITALFKASQRRKRRGILLLSQAKCTLKMKKLQLKKKKFKPPVSYSLQLTISENRCGSTGTSCRSQSFTKCTEQEGIDFPSKYMFHSSYYFIFLKLFVCK